MEIDRNLVRRSVRSFGEIPKERQEHEIDKIISWCRESNCRLFIPSPKEAPYLAHGDGEGHVLYVLGDSSLLGLKAMAVVGSRRPSLYGTRAAMHFSRELALLGFVVVSGLARGIDAAAHRATLAAKGKTIAVLGHGLDRIYPAEHYALAQSIVGHGGALVCEYPPWAAPLKHHFPQRNRIISALSLGTVVVEAQPGSGSLITARWALEQNREVFVVPAHYDDRSFYGGHRLIQEGAKLVCSIDDILVELPIQCVEEVVAQGKPQKEGLPELERLFAKKDNVVSLEDLLCSSSLGQGELLEQLERGIDQGVVVQTEPQSYVWLGRGH